MEEIVFRVQKRDGGWIVMGDRQIGAITDRANAIDLASGMVEAIRRSGTAARFEIEDDALERKA